MIKLRDLRKDYRQKALDRKDLDPNPFLQFDTWFQEALKAEIPEPNAMILATVNDQYRPSARVLLLKDYSDEGFLFFTNYNSQKALELEKHPFASMVFWWRLLMRQVRLEGKVIKADPKITEDYFAGRNRLANISVYASKQSQPIDSRKTLLKAFEDSKRKFEDQEEIPCPDFWGGYLLIPDIFEFWSGGENRLHDRFRYTLQSDHQWLIERLAP